MGRKNNEMAYIEYDNLKSLIVKPINNLSVIRDHKYSGKNALHPVVAKRYAERYDSEPKTKEEATKLGVKGFNGLNTSYIDFCIAKSEINKGELTLSMMPTYFHTMSAFKDLEGTGNYSDKELMEMTPKMANVSLLTIVKDGGKYFALTQIKGTAVDIRAGPGQFQGALAAGGVKTKYMRNENPLISNLKMECSEEIGLDLSTLGPTSIAYGINEFGLGNYNFQFVPQCADLANLINTYSVNVQKKVVSEKTPIEKLEVSGLGLIPLEGGISIGNDLTLQNIRCYIPNPNGTLDELILTKPARPLLWAQISAGVYVNPSKAKYLLEKAGF